MACARVRETHLSKIIQYRKNCLKSWHKCKLILRKTLENWKIISFSSFFKNVLLSKLNRSLHCKYVQWNYSGSAFKKILFLKKYSFLLLTYVRCIFYKLKIVSLTLFSCSLFYIELNVHITSFHCEKTVKIKKMAKIHSSVVYRFNLTTFSQQA